MSRTGYGMKKRRDAERRDERVEVLMKELDVQGERAIERTRAIEGKASFTLAAAAAVVAASFSSLSGGPLDWLVMLPLVLAGVTIIVASRAIRPLIVSAPSARALITEYVDADLTSAQLRDTILEVRAREIEYRDELNQRRSQSMIWSFRVLLASVLVLVSSALVVQLF
jgi:hypothetical protein